MALHRRIAAAGLYAGLLALAMLAGGLVAPQVVAASVAPAESAAATGPQHPRILFDDDGAAALRVRITSDVPKLAWERLQSRAEAYTTPGNPNYVDPLLVDEDPYDGWIYRNGETKVHGTSLKPYDGLLGQSQLSTVLSELSFAYQMSLNTKYGRHAAEILLQLARNNWPVWACEGKVGPNQIGCDLGIGDQLAGIGLAFDWVYDLLSQDERDLIVGKLTEYKTYLFGVVFNDGPSANPQSNWMGVSAGGAGLAALAIRGEAGAPADLDVYLEQALVRAGRYLHEGSTDQGDSVEGYVYAGYGLKNTVPFALSARRLGWRDVITASNAQKNARWAVYEQIPGRGNMMVPLNDSTATIMSPSVLTYMMALDPDDGVAQWFWQRTAGPKGDNFYGRLPRSPVFVTNTDCSPLDRSPGMALAYCEVIRSSEDVNHILWWRSLEETPEVSPTAAGQPLSEHFVEQGLVDSRTGFDNGEADLVSTFAARRKAFGHYQYDLGSFTLYGAGANWAVDSGYSCVVCGKTADSGYATGHNVVLVDSDKFTQSAADVKTSVTTIDGHLAAPGFSWARADLRYVYGQRADGTFVSPTASRDRFLSHAPGRPAILAVTDHLNRDGGFHKYHWQMHTDAANVLQLDLPFGPGFKLTAPNGAVMVGEIASAGLLVNPRPVLPTVFKQEVTQDIHPVHTVLYTDSVPAPGFNNLAVMAVTQPGQTPATLETVAAPGGDAVTVTASGVTDVVVSKLTNAAVVTGNEVATDGTFARLTRGAGETLLVGGTSLTSQGRSYVRVTGSSAEVAVSGGSVQAIGASTNSYRVFAPQPITEVTVNGVAVSSCRDGSDLLFPCQAVTALALAAPATAQSTDLVSLSATLTSAGAPLAGRPVAVSVGDITGQVLTDSGGTARVSLPLDLDPGPYAVTATYLGDSRHAPSVATVPLQVLPDATILAYTGETQARGETVAVSALLTDDDNTPLGGQPVQFSIGPNSLVVITDSSGRAAGILSVPEHGQSQLVDVRYVGASRYEASSVMALMSWGRPPD